MRPSPTRRAVTVAAAILTAGTLAAGSISAPAEAAPETRLAERLVRQTNITDTNRHLIALQRIADSNGGNRAAPDGTRAEAPGYDASVEYVAGQLRRAGFVVRTPEFGYEVEVTDAALLRIAGTTYEVDILTNSPQTPVGGITGPLRAVSDSPGDAAPGCEAADFAGQDFTGSVALIRRGGCNFSVKSENAAAAGAVAAVIANNSTTPVSPTLGDESGNFVPTGFVTQADGNTLFGQAGTAATVDMRYHNEDRTSRNVIAETRTGRARNVVMAGAHLDSVEVGPGINDNGSGSAALLDVALKLGGSPNVGNRVRFAWWGAEELGLLGSEAYVESLSFEQQVDIALYLNFDMVGSPNAAYFVYDGDDSDGVGAGEGPVGSDHIEQTFVDFFDSRLGIETEGTDFSGRSDYGGFIAVGIPSGGLFTGAEGVKTAEQAAKWGGTAGVAYDPCYHAACDNLGNVDRVAIGRNLDAMAWAVGVYAYSTEDINGVPPRAQRLKVRNQAKNKIKIARSYVPSDKVA